jgi:hypothetical protein
VDFKKWNSGMYADEFIGKPVLVEGYFQKNPMAGSYQGSDIIFSVLEKSSSQMVRLQQRWAAGDRTESVTDMLSLITVTAPLAMRDVIYPIRDEQRVRVYGVVVNPYATSVFTGRVVMSALTVRADRVEIAR